MAYNIYPEYNGILGITQMVESASIKSACIEDNGVTVLYLQHVFIVI